MRSYTNLPVELCRYALAHRKVNHLRLYLLLKLNSDGYITDNAANRAQWAKELGLTPKSIRNLLGWLIEQRWITVNSKRGVFHILSYGRLSRKLSMKFTTGFSYDCGVHKDFRALCCGVVICYFLRRKRYFKRQSGSNKGGPTTNCKRMNGYTQMANSYLARCMGVSTSSAFRIKQLAEEHGYIKTKYGYEYIRDAQGERLNPNDYSGYRDYRRGESGKDTIRKGKIGLVEVASDYICSYLWLKRKRCRV